MTNLIAELAARAHSGSQSSPEARCIAARAFADTVGCIVVGASEPMVSRMRSGLVPGARPAPLPWPGAEFDQMACALVNGTAAHVLEFDDHEPIGVTHPSSVLVPALLSLVPGSQCSGKALLDAYVAGYEAICAIAKIFGPNHYRAGWHSTSTIGMLGAAVSCADLLGCSEAQLANAISIACSMAGGTRAQFGFMSKPLHAGLAAQSGVMAAILAQSGLVASPDALDGRFGIVSLMAGADNRGGRRELPTISIQDNPPIIKLHPACAATHRSVDAVIDLTKDNALESDDIVGITTEVPDVAASALLDGYPTTPSAARFSMSYCLSCAAINGRLTLKDFSASALDRPHVRRLSEAITTTSYATDGDPFAAGKYRTRTIIETRSGRRFSSERLHANGSKSMPLTIEQLRSKFDECVSYAPDDIGFGFDRIVGLANESRAMDVFVQIR